MGIDFVMACLPLIERELRVALRKQRPARGRLKIAAIAAGGSMLFIFLGALTEDRSVGRNLEQLLCFAGLFCVLRAPALTAGVLAEERRNQTLGLLFLSGLGAGEVFVSKFLSSALIAFTNLLAIFPMLALPFLIGGVSYDLFLATVCALPVLMLFALALSLLASVLTRDDGAAVILAMVMGTLICALTPAIFLAQTHFSPGAKPSSWWLRLSPVFGPRLIWNGFRSGFSTGERLEFWRNLGVTLCWSALALGIAAFALKRIWRDTEVVAETGSWRARWREFLHGSSEKRRRLARKWLEANPFVWLSGRDWQPAMLGWLVIGGMAFVWLICLAVWPAQWPGSWNFFITAMAVNLVLLWLIRHTAAHEIARARRDGAYELLLTTPLNPSDIVWGILEMLKVQFRPLANFVLSLNALLMLGGLVSRKWNTGALIEYFIIWFFLIAWTWNLGCRMLHALPVMWTSLNCGRAAYAVWRNSGSWSWISWIWILSNARFLGRGVPEFPTGSLPEMVIFCTLAVCGGIIWLALRVASGNTRVEERVWDPNAKVWLRSRSSLCETRLIREFREIVREPLPDPSDPRFKKWNVAERFPWGWAMAQQQLHERLARNTGKSWN